MAADYVSQIQVLRAEVAKVHGPSAARAATLAALSAAEAAMVTLAAEERTAVETLAGDALNTLSPEEVSAWIEIRRAKRTAGR